jgi:hypothetical protein
MVAAMMRSLVFYCSSDCESVLYCRYEQAIEYYFTEIVMSNGSTSRLPEARVLQ